MTSRITTPTFWKTGSAVNVVLNVFALRFLRIKVLKRRDMKEDLPYPKAIPAAAGDLESGRGRPIYWSGP